MLCSLRTNFSAQFEWEGLINWGEYYFLKRFVLFKWIISFLGRRKAVNGWMHKNLTNPSKLCVNLNNFLAEENFVAKFYYLRVMIFIIVFSLWYCCIVQNCNKYISVIPYLLFISLRLILCAIRFPWEELPYPPVKYFIFFCLVCLHGIWIF